MVAPPSLRRRPPIAVLATVMSLAALLVACSGSDKAGPVTGGGPNDSAVDRPELPPCPLDALGQATQPVEVVVWHFLQAKTKEALEQIATKYNASQSKVRVRIENQGSSNDELWKKYQQGIQSRDLPGIAILDDTVTRQMVDSETVLPAQSCIDADRYDTSDFLPTAMSYYTIGGALYPSSLDLSGALLYYNKNHFRRSGLDAEVAPKNLEELRTFAAKIKAAGVVDKPIILQLSPSLIENFLTGAKVPLVDNENGRGGGETTKAAFDRPETVELFRWVRSMVDDGLLDVLPQTPGQIGQYLAMANQKASMTIETSTAATSIEAFLKGDLKTDGLPGGVPTTVDTSALDIGAGPVPGITEPGKLEMGGGAWYMMSTTPPEVQAAAWDFSKYFNSRESQVTWNLVGGYLPYRMSAAKDPAITEMWTNTLAGRWLAIAYDELLHGVDPAFPGPLIGPYDDVRQALRDSVDELVFKGVPPDQAVTHGADATNAALERYNKGGF